MTLSVCLSTVCTSVRVCTCGYVSPPITLIFLLSAAVDPSVSFLLPVRRPSVYSSVSVFCLYTSGRLYTSVCLSAHFFDLPSVCSCRSFGVLRSDRPSSIRLARSVCLSSVSARLSIYLSVDSSVLGSGCLSAPLPPSVCSCPCFDVHVYTDVWCEGEASWRWLFRSGRRRVRDAEIDVTDEQGV